jgi:hypothetical protein
MGGKGALEDNVIPARRNPTQAAPRMTSRSIAYTAALASVGIIIERPLTMTQERIMNSGETGSKLGTLWRKIVSLY